MVNIPRTVKDPKHRYKMPIIRTKVEGKGINISTNILNLIQVAKALRIGPIYIIKWLEYEMGSNTQFVDTKQQKKASIRGNKSVEDLMRCLDKFIRDYIVCPGCGDPELVTSVNDGAISSRCNACGRTTSVDVSHKLSKFMIKNPPKNLQDIQAQAKQEMQKKQFKARKYVLIKKY